MSESMTRVGPGEYTVRLGELDYSVLREQERITTGRTKAGRVETTWRAFRGDFLLAETARYADAKDCVYRDYHTPHDQRPQPFRPEATDEPTDDEQGENLAEWEYPQGEGGESDEEETPIGGPTSMERDFSFSR